MTISLEAVTSAEAVQAVARLAGTIWRQHYPPIIGADQVEYMLAQFQDERAIAAALAEGQEYWLLRVEGQPAGYLAVAPDSVDPGALQLSKIYLRAERRGSGLGTLLLHRAEERARARERPRLWLTVNRGNTEALRWYKRRGFQVTREVIAEIGGGFVMDDYRLEKWIPEKGA